VYLFNVIFRILETEFSFENKGTALRFFQQLRQLFRGWNSVPWQSREFEAAENEIQTFVSGREGAG
jgi:hypothetical protein